MNKIIFFIIAISGILYIQSMATESYPEKVEQPVQQENLQQPNTPLSLIQELFTTTNPDEQHSILEKMNKLPAESWEYGPMHHFLHSMDLEGYDRLFGILLNSNIKLDDNILEIMIKSLFDDEPIALYFTITKDTPNIALFIAKNPKILKNINTYYLNFIFSENLKEFFLTPENINTLFELTKSPDTPLDLKVELLKILFESPDFRSLSQQINNIKEKNMLHLQDTALKDKIIEMIIPQQNDWVKNAEILIKLNAGNDLETKWVEDPLVIELENKFMNTPNSFPNRFKLLVKEHPKERIIHNIFAIFTYFELQIETFKNTFPALEFLESKEEDIIDFYLLFIAFHWKSVIEILQDNKSFFDNKIKEISIPPKTIDKIKTVLSNPTTQTEMNASKLGWLYSSLTFNVYKEDLKQSNKNEKKFSISIKYCLPELYKSNLLKFSQMIFSDVLEQPTETERVSYIHEAVNAIIYNQASYDQGFNFTENEIYKKGIPLRLNNKTPIGYNIHLPRGEVKAVFVNVYGGDQASEKKERMSQPGSLSSFERALLNQGVAIVTLNLVNFLELRTHQLNMPKSLHDRLHASISFFAKKIRQDPTSLASPTDPSQITLLSSLEGKPVYLYGGSFGGGTTIRQAELDPNSFDGYMSHNGGVSMEMGHLSDLEIVSKKTVC